jgi:general stress protein 26
VFGGRRLTKAETESLLKEAKIARFCSLNEDGTIHAAPVWFRYENGKIVTITPDNSVKAKNVKRNKNVTVLIDETTPKVRTALIIGTAKITQKDALLATISICEKYMPKQDAKRNAEALFPKTRWAKITVTPQHITSFDYPT